MSSPLMKLQTNSAETLWTQKQSRHTNVEIMCNPYNLMGDNSVKIVVALE